MKRIFSAVTAAALILLTLCSCNSQGSSSAADPPQTFAVAETQTQTPDTTQQITADSDTVSEISAVLIGTWVNENDYTERYIFTDNLRFERYLGANKSEGTITLGSDGTLQMTFGTEDVVPKIYQKTESPDSTDKDGWYLDDNHFILGDTRLVKTVDY